MSHVRGRQDDFRICLRDAFRSIASSKLLRIARTRRTRMRSFVFNHLRTLFNSQFLVSLFFSSDCALFAKNTRGRGIAVLKKIALSPNSRGICVAFLARQGTMRPMNRRTFISASVATSIGGSLAASTLFGSPLSRAASALSGFSGGDDHHVAPIGLQLYTLREMMKTDVPGTLAKVAGVGYKEVEVAGYFDHSPKEFRALLDSNGLSSPSSHIDYATVEMMLPKAIETAHIMGQSYLVCPYFDEKQRKDPEVWKRAAEVFNHAGEQCSKAGVQFCYHNHTFEFEPSAAVGGKFPYDYLLENTDAKLVRMEMDLCWATVAGADPLTYFAKYPGRFPLVHVKDWQGQGGSMSEQATRMRDVGQGSIDWKRIFAHSEQAGIKHYIVENDAAKSVDDIAISYKYLTNLNY